MSKLKNEIGNHYGKLTVVERVENSSSGNAMWKCLCECGNYTIASGTDLRRGHSQSCGCHITDARHKNTLVGRRFGRLVVLERDEDYEAQYFQGKHSLSYWKCKCDCGNISTHSYNSLMNGTSSCGCLNSRGEYKIHQLLTQNNISFEQQKVFSTCRYLDTNCLARFDFYINNEFLLEYDGEQHFYYDDRYWNTNNNFELVKKRDKFKNNWCKENNIILKRIPYWDLQRLTIEDIMSDKYIVKDE